MPSGLNTENPVRKKLYTPCYTSCAVGAYSIALPEIGL
jgi:hypothetical protein